jgi:hypothetical protein
MTHFALECVIWDKYSGFYSHGGFPKKASLRHRDITHSRLLALPLPSSSCPLRYTTTCGGPEVTTSMDANTIGGAV